MKAKKYTKAVVIGRFNPFIHKGHESLFARALDIADRVYVLVGSANQYPDVKNPLDAQTRISAVHNVLHRMMGGFDDSVASVKPLNDYKYNDERWKTEVRTLIEETPDDKVAIIGFDKDVDSYWLHEFDWAFEPVEPYMVFHYGKKVPMSNTFVRDNWLRTGHVAVGSTDSIAPESLEIVTQFTYDPKMRYTDEFLRLSDERTYWDNELKKFESYPYQEALNCCTGDAVVLCKNHILLIERKYTPGKGAWALPGGHKEARETFRYCALRELEEEVNLRVPSKVLRGSIKAEKLFDDPNRSPVFSKPTVAQFIVLQPDADGSLPKTRPSSDAKSAKWVPLHEIVRGDYRLFDDHLNIIQYFTGI